MTVTNENGTLRVVLSEAETIHYGIDNVLFNENSPEAKSALKKLLRSAVASVKPMSDASRFLIEIYPVFDGGCEVFFIPSSGGAKRFKAVKKCRPKPYIVAELQSGEAVMRLCHRLYRLNVCFDNRLFKYRGRFRLVLNADSELITVIGEYCNRVSSSRLEMVKTYEYGEEICQNAVEQIGKTLDRR